MIDENRIYVGDLGGLNMRDITDWVTSADVSWTMDEVSQLSFEVYDYDLSFLANNYFQVRRDVVIEGGAFQIASVNVSQSPAVGATVRIEARRSAIQAMKRDKDPGSISASSGTEYARLAAERYGLAFQGEFTETVPNITPVQNSQSDESVWSVITSLAGQAQFVVFEYDNTLYFASERWLLGKYGLPTLIGNTIPLFWPGPPESWARLFDVMEIPECYTSDDDPYQAEFKAVIDRTNAYQLRPGMTVDFDGIPMFRGRYLITEVSYELNSPNPVSVSCRTPQKPVDKEGKFTPEYRTPLG